MLSQASHGKIDGHLKETPETSLCVWRETINYCQSCIWFLHYLAKVVLAGEISEVPDPARTLTTLTDNSALQGGYGQLAVQGWGAQQC